MSDSARPRLRPAFAAIGVPVLAAAAGAAWLAARWGWDPVALGVFAVSGGSLLLISRREDAASRAPRRLPVAPPYLMWCAASVLGFLLVHYHSPEASYLPIFDTLDGTLPIYALLSTLPVFDGLDATVSQLLGGVPKNSVYSQLNLYAALFRVLPPASAYVAHDAILRVVGLVGMLLLLRRHLTPRASDLAVAGAATTFALLPHLAAACLSVAGLPLLLCALLEILERPAARWPWPVVALFPFASMLPLIGWGALGVLGGAVAIHAIRERQIPWRGALALALLVFGQTLAEYRLLYQLFFEPGYVSQRVEYGPLLSFSSDAAGLARSVLRHVRAGFPHAASLHEPLVWGAAAAAVALAAANALRRRAGAKQQLARLGVCGAALAAFAIVFSVSFHRPFQEWLLAADVGALRTLHLSRLAWWEPALWYTVFALALDGFTHSGAGSVGRAVACVLIALQLTFVFFTNDFYERRDSIVLRYREFASPELFREIQDYIGRPLSEYRVASLGMPASLATLNGFSTADGYLGNYPLAYKHRFRRLIAAELAQDDNLRRRFDLWGARCHVVSHELPFSELGPNFAGYTKRHRPRRITKLALDPAALADLGIDYLLSAVEILSPERSGLEPVRVFARDDSPWEIHLYARRR